MGLFTYGRCIYCKKNIWRFVDTNNYYSPDPEHPEKLAHTSCHGKNPQPGMGMLFLLLTLGFAADVRAQAHPCDQAPPATVTIVSNAPHRVQFCSADKPEALLGIVDTVPHDLVPVTVKTATPSASGLYMYESNVFIQVPKGQHELVVRLYNRNASTGQLQLGEATAPFGFTAVDDTPPAAAPKILNVIK